MTHDELMLFSGVLIGVGLSIFWYWWGQAYRYAEAWNAGSKQQYQEDCESAKANGCCPPPPGNVLRAK